MQELPGTEPRSMADRTSSLTSTISLAPRIYSFVCFKGWETFQTMFRGFGGMLSDTQLSRSDGLMFSVLNQECIAALSLLCWGGCEGLQDHNPRGRGWASRIIVLVESASRGMHSNA